MSAFIVMRELIERGADLSPMFRTWMELSEEKGWPQNEEGWRRYLARVSETGGFPTVAQRSVVQDADPPPIEFVAWWRAHEDCSFQDGQCQPSERIAWRCAGYREKWKAETI